MDRTLNEYGYELDINQIHIFRILNKNITHIIEKQCMIFFMIESLVRKVKY
jgi:hypothetical protein